MGSISNVVVAGDVIDSIVEHLDGVLEGVPESHKIVALISYALCLQNPDLTAPQAVEGVKQISQFMCLWLDGLNTERLTEEEQKRRVN